MPILYPEQFDQTPPYDLLREAEMGRIGFDQRLLRSLMARPDETIPALVRFASEFRSERLLDLDEQLVDLFRHFRTPAAIPFYLRLARQHDDGMPDSVVDGFVELGGQALEPLIAAYRESDPAEDGVNIPFVLAGIRIRDDRVKAILLETLERDPYEGALCLGLYGDPATREALEAVTTTSPSEKRAIEDALRELTTEVLTTPTDPFDLLAQYAEVEQPDFAAMSQGDCLEFLDSKDAEYRRLAAESFNDESYSARVKAKLFAHAQDDEDAAVRGACWCALREALENEPKIQAAMEAVLVDRNRAMAEREGALLGLSGLGGTVETIQEFYDNPETRAVALEAMWRSADRRWKPNIVESLKSEDSKVVSQAIFGVGALNLTDCADELIPSFGSEDLRGDALFAYALATPGKTSVKAVLKLFERIDELAGGLNAEDSEIVSIALDRRLEREGLEPHFYPLIDDAEDEGDGGYVHGGHVH